MTLTVLLDRTQPSTKGAVMAVLNLFTRLDIVDRCGCVECDARTNEPCYSRFLQRPMVNEVHRSRRADAAKVQPARGRG